MNRRHIQVMNIYTYSTEIQIMFHINLLFAKFKINSQVRKMKWSAREEKKKDEPRGLQ